MPATLAAFVLGDLLLQQCARLPEPSDLAFCLGCALAFAGTAVALWRGAGPRAAQGCAGFAALAMFLAGFSYAAASAGWRMADALDWADEGIDLRVQAVVASLPSRFEGGSHFVADVEQVLHLASPSAGDDRMQSIPQSTLRSIPRVPRRISLSWYEPGRTVLPAQRWQWTVRLRRPQASINPTGFDAEAWMLEQGIRAAGTVRAGTRDEPVQLIDSLVWQFDPVVDRARAWLRDLLQQILAERRYGAVIVALVMGDQGAIAEQDWALFNRTGISHLVSISGLHITMIAAVVALLAGGLWRRSAGLLRLATVPVVRALAAILGALAYCLLAGWGVPAQRTLLMLSVVALGQIWRARLGPANILASAALLVCLWDPWAVLAAGFWLSFGAVACIFLASSGRLAPEPGWRNGACEGARMQAAITVGQVPLTLAIFGQVSIVAPLANAVAIPLVSYLVAPLALVGAGLAACGEYGRWAGAWLLHLSEALFGLLARLLELLVTPSWSWFALPMPPQWTLAAAALGCAWLLAPAGWPLRWIGLCALLPMFVWPVEQPGPGELWATALDVGQGMCVVLETSDHVVVFDTGPRFSADADAGSRVLVPYLRARGIRRVDVLVVSHQDIDHAGGAGSLLASFPVDRIWTSVPPGHRLLQAVASQPDAVLTRCEAGQSLHLDGLALTMLSPAPELYARARASTNSRSCVVHAQLGSHRVLLTGDVPVRQERQLLARAAGMWHDMQVELLIAPHHGSHSSSSEELITASSPRWVSMQLGYRNHFGHPHAGVLERYRAHGVQVVRSDECGAAQWRFDSGAGVTIERWRLDHARYWHNQPIHRLQEPGQ